MATDDGNAVIAGDLSFTWVAMSWIGDKAVPISIRTAFDDSWGNLYGVAVPALPVGIDEVALSATVE